MHESASDLHETLSAYCPHRGQQSNKFSASTEFPLSNYKNKAKFIDDVISGDHVIFRNFKHIRYTHRDGIYKTWGRSKLYLENCGQEVTYQNVTYLCIHLYIYLYKSKLLITSPLEVPRETRYVWFELCSFSKHPFLPL